MIRYYCQGDLWPIIQGVLAANAYSIAVPPQRSRSGATTMVMMRGLATVLFTQLPDSETLELEVEGVAQSAVAQLLGTLRFSLYKQAAAAGG
jgi:hypothetical protein